MEMKVAEAAVSFAVGKLGEALINKLTFLQGVADQVNLLKGELEIMYGLIQDATQKQDTSNAIRVWISQMRKVALDVEDVIETFTLEIDNPRTSGGRLENILHLPRQAKHLNNLGKEIQKIRDRLKILFDSRVVYGIKGLEEGPQVRRPNTALDARRLVPQGKDKDLVGLDNDIRRLLRQGILTEESGLSVARITGMGGLGKSTLAREVYNHCDVVDRFKYRAWVVVSEDFNAKQVIKELVLKLVGRQSNMDELPVEDLKGILYQHLEDKEYFIVLDDVWRQEHWDSLADAFPAGQQGKRSRLLVTSRTQTVPITALYHHELNPLNPDMSWQLFLKKSGCADGDCTSILEDVEDIGRQIVEKCGGLPLAITVIGGLVRKQRQSPSAWRKVLKDLNSHLTRSDSRISAVLELSYNDLSPLLKSCFLCLAFFKEDAIICAEKLIQVWIAEGLISEERGGKTIEETSIDCLDELINRNMVQVKDMNECDEVISCQMHDLLHELSIKKAELEIGFKSLKEGINSQAPDESRHRAIYCSAGDLSLSENPNDKHVRSLFFYGAANIGGASSLKFSNFKLLRLLDFEGFGLRRLPETICERIGLKYLSLKDNNLDDLPKSLGKLKNLQVLDIFGNYGIRVPNIIWKLGNLRHLYMTDFDVIGGETLRLDTLNNLQTLILFPKNGMWSPKDVMKMTNLHKLEVPIDISITDVREFITSLGELMNLASLKLKLVRRNTTLEGLDTLQSLNELSLLGELRALPSSVVNFPPNLSRLTLSGNKLKEDPMPVLEKLPNLLYLNLNKKAYAGGEMVISDDGFPKLRNLLVDELFKLRKMKLVGRGIGMPRLERFEVKGCDELESLPIRLMKLVKISGCPKMRKAR